MKVIEACQPFLDHVRDCTHCRPVVDGPLAPPEMTFQEDLARWCPEGQRTLRLTMRRMAQ